MKRIVTMQDLSCIGKCSLTVAAAGALRHGAGMQPCCRRPFSRATAFEGFRYEPLLAHAGRGPLQRSACSST